METKNCLNCKYYAQHFACTCSSYLIKTNCGHCVKRNLKRLQKPKCFDGNYCCDLWESKCLLVNEKNVAIESVLRKMSNRINDIARILKYYNTDK